MGSRSNGSIKVGKMPIYSYTCLKCDTNIERMCLIENRNNQFCVDCGYRLAREVDKPGMV